jgi:hypothetical protein
MVAFDGGAGSGAVGDGASAGTSVGIDHEEI